MSCVTMQGGIPRIAYDMAEVITPSLSGEFVGFEAAERQPYPQHVGKRLSAPGIHGFARTGFTDIVRVSEGLHVIITRWPSDAHSAVWAETVPGECGYLYIGLEGDGCIEIEGLGKARRPGASCSITVAPRSSTYLWRTGPGVVRRGICIAFHAQYLQRHYPELSLRSAHALAPWLCGRETEMRDFEVPLLPAIQASTVALLSTQLEGQFRYVFVRSTAEQLLCLALASLTDRSVALTRLSARDRRIIDNVRLEMDENLTDPPNIEDLARHHGINRNKLRFGFKEVFGTSLAEYLFQQRMRIALELLEHGGHTVNEVADILGYAHVCNFTTSFKRRFGRTPSSV